MTYEAYRFSIPIDVRFGDIDAMGHVNNAVFFTYLEQSRLQYMLHLGLPAFRATKLNFILAEVSCQFKAPILYENRLEVKSRVERMGNSSITMTHQIEDRLTRQVMAIGRSVVVVYDYELNQSAPLPIEWRAAIEKFEAGS